MTLLEILAAVKSNTARDDKDAVARTGVTLALQRIAGRHPFKGFLVTSEFAIAAGAQGVSLLPNTIRVIRAYWINDTQSWAIKVRSREWVLKRIANLAAWTASYPDWGYLEGGFLYVTPAPSIDGTIRITAQVVPTVVNDSDVTPISLIDEAVIGYATAWVFKSVQMYQDAAVWDGVGEQALATAIRADLDQPAIEHVKDQFGMKEGCSPDPVHDPFAQTIWD